MAGRSIESSDAGDGGTAADALLRADARVPQTARHRFEHDSSILAVAVAGQTLYAGTQGGEILVYDLNTYQRRHVRQAHAGPVLGLSLTQRGALLLSSAGDRKVNVWEPEGMTLLASLWSHEDLGDVFCLAWSPALQTIYLGAQNTSIQWYNFDDYDPRLTIDLASHPSKRQDPFFDSLGPSGLQTPRSTHPLETASLDRSVEIGKDNVQNYAHYGYVNCMLYLERGPKHGLQEDTLVTGAGDGTIKLWSLDAEAGGRPVERGCLSDGSDGGESVLSIALNGTFLYGARMDGWINVWDLTTREMLRTIDTTTRQDVLTLAFGGGLLYAGMVDGTVKTFNHRHDLVKSWEAHEGRVLSSCFVESDDQYLLVTGGGDGTVAVWGDQRDDDTQQLMPRTSRVHLTDALSAFVSFHSVSSDPGCVLACRSAARFLRDLLKGFGACTDILANSQGFNPVVLARFERNNGAETPPCERIIFYGHYDVISALNTTGKWRTDPFVLHGIDDHLYGRGASDNKGPIMAAIYAVAELVSKRQLAVDVIFLIEGEEEMGSRGFQDTVRHHKRRIGPIDWILLANSYWINDETPCLTYGLRGVLRVTVKIESDQPDLHSGVDGSTLVKEPMKHLFHLIASLTGPDDRVEIPGFYDNIPPLEAEERALYDQITAVLLAQDPKMCGGVASDVTASLIAKWREPNLTIHSVRYSGPGNPTIISGWAEAVVSTRLVPGQEVDEIQRSLETLLQTNFALLTSKNRLTVTVDHKAEPWLGHRTNRLFTTLEKAVMDTWSNGDSEFRGDSQVIEPSTGTATNAKPSSSRPSRKGSSSGAQQPVGSRKPLYIREGGSIPAIRFLEKEFDAQAAHLPCGQASDAAHLDNERFRVLNLYKAKEVFSRVFAGLNP